LTSGIAVNAQNKNGETALMIAADNDQVEMVEALLEAGADANLADNESETAIEKTSNAEVKSLLISFGAVAKSN
jgi:ankyrin repeat protein